MWQLSTVVDLFRVKMLRSSPASAQTPPLRIKEWGVLESSFFASHILNSTSSKIQKNPFDKKEQRPRRARWLNAKPKWWNMKRREADSGSVWWESRQHAKLAVSSGLIACVCTFLVYYVRYHLGQRRPSILAASRWQRSGENAKCLLSIQNKGVLSDARCLSPSATKAPRIMSSVYVAICGAPRVSVRPLSSRFASQTSHLKQRSDDSFWRLSWARVERINFCP